MELAVVYMMQGGLFSLLTYRISCFKGWVCAEVVSAAAQQAGCKLLTADAEWGVDTHCHWRRRVQKPNFRDPKIIRFQPVQFLNPKPKPL